MKCKFHKNRNNKCRLYHVHKKWKLETSNGSMFPDLMTKWHKLTTKHNHYAVSKLEQLLNVALCPLLPFDGNRQFYESNNYLKSLLC